MYHLNQLTHGWIIDYYVHDTDRWMKAIVNVPSLYTRRETTSGFVSEPWVQKWSSAEGSKRSKPHFNETVE